MPRELDRSLWSLVSPAIAKRFHVIPLGQEGKSLRLLTDANLSERQRKNREAQLSALIGKTVILELLPSLSPPQADAKEFQHILRQYYDIDLDCLTVLLVDPIDGWAHEYADIMKQYGHVVIHVTSLEEAMSRASSPRRKLDMVLIADEIDSGFCEAKEKLGRIIKVPICRVAGVDPRREQHDPAAAR